MNRVEAENRPRLARWALFGVALGLIAIVGVLYGAPYTEADVHRIRPLTLQQLRDLPQGEIENFQSSFSHIVVRKESTNLALYFKKGGFLYKETEIDLSNPERLVLAYGELAPAALMYTPHHRRFLLLGLGGGAISNYFHRFIPDMYIDGVEIDGGVAAMAVRYFLTNPGVNYDVHVEDARRFVQDTGHKYDLVMGDAYGGGYIPEHLITVEFYREVKAILNSGGVLFLNLYDDEVHERTLVTLHRVFDHTHTYFSPSNASRIVVAFDGPEPSQKELMERATQLQQKYGFYHELPGLLKHRRAVTMRKGLKPYHDSDL